MNTTTTRTTQARTAFGRLVLRGELALKDGAGEAALLVGIAAGSLLALVSLLAPAL